MKIYALITAAGSGKRMGSPKQFIDLLGEPMLIRTVKAFSKLAEIDGIVIVVEKNNIKKVKDLNLKKVKAVAPGGAERQDSVFNGLKTIPDDADIVVVHDGARPFVSKKMILDSVKEAKLSGACVVGVPVKDTIKRVERNNDVTATLDRSLLWVAQTPQTFKRELILKAYRNAQGKHLATDDSALVEMIGIKVKMIMGSYDNIKVTTREDLVLAEKILKNKEIK